MILYFRYTDLTGNPPLGNHDDFRKNLLDFYFIFVEKLYAITGVELYAIPMP